MISSKANPGRSANPCLRANPHRDYTKNFGNLANIELSEVL